MHWWNYWQSCWLWLAAKSELDCRSVLWIRREHTSLLLAKLACYYYCRIVDKAYTCGTKGQGIYCKYNLQGIVCSIISLLQYHPYVCSSNANCSIDSGLYLWKSRFNLFPTWAEQDNKLSIFSLQPSAKLSC